MGGWEDELEICSDVFCSLTVLRRQLSDQESALPHRQALYEWEKYTNVLKH